MRLAVIAVLFLAALVRADAVTLKKPVAVELTPKDKSAVVKGRLISYDDEQATIKVAGEEKQILWADVTPASAYAARLRTIDRKVAKQWFDLGAWAWKIGAESEAKTAFDQSAKLKSSFRAEADMVLATPSGAAPPAGETASGGEGVTTVPPPDAPPEQPGRDDPTAKITHFQPATPEQHAKALAGARKIATAVEQELNVKLAEFETDHFLVLTDWDPAEYDFLKKNVEDAYRVVAKQFEMSPKDNIFVGKLPIYMFAKPATFQQFSADIDGFPTTKNVLGYYRGRGDGSGHMAMWKPDTSGNPNNTAAAERDWAYTLTHEFTHAFVARYRTNVRIPRWMNEGIAEVIASGVFPKPQQRAWARTMAINKADISQLFDDAKMPTGEYYPVMMTMVETLVVRDRRAFLKTFNAIKDGTEPEAALKKFYKLDNAGLTEAWLAYARTVR